MLTVFGMKTPKTTLAERLQLAIARAGVNQKQLVRACRTSPSAVTQWLDGSTKNLKLANLFAAAEFLGVSAAWLAGYSDDMGPPASPELLRMWEVLTREERVALQGFLLALSGQRQLENHRKKPIALLEDRRDDR